MSLAFLGSKFGHQVVSLVLPHCLGLPFWHYQLVLSLYLHQPESHQLSLQKVSHSVSETRTHRSDQRYLGPIKMYILYQVRILKSGKSQHHKHGIFHIKSCMFFMRWFWHCAFSCASSIHLVFCRHSCIACRQKVSLRCVKTCDTSNHWSCRRRSCTAYI